ncbi:MAG: hypothetical protein CMJ78_17600 [Planctomycetaceae bacterium]|nr:hypothetical protein [Planctomycetaceae bacterium]
MHRTIAELVTLMLVSVSIAEEKGAVLLDDDFNRSEKDPTKEQVGNGWGTNSARRAKGVKQVDLVDGAMHITKAKVADHGVSVTHEAAFRDAVIQLRFKLGSKDDLGINIADMKEKSVHAGHICVARIRPKRVELTDLKTGRMNLKLRQRRLEGKLTEEDKERFAATSKRFPTDIAVDKWHQLQVRIESEVMRVSIDGKLVGKFASEGIAHGTKSRLRLSVNRQAWVDDVKIVRLK